MLDDRLLFSVMTSSINHLVLIFLRIVVHNVEESQLINTLGGGDNSEPVSQLLLLEEFFCPVQSISSAFIPLTYIFPRSEEMVVYSQVLEISARELRVRNNLDLSIANLGDLDGISEVSDTAINLDLVLKDFSKAETSKILSLAGCEALMMNFGLNQHSSTSIPNSPTPKHKTREVRGFWPCGWPWPACPWLTSVKIDDLSLLYHAATSNRRANSKAISCTYWWCHCFVSKVVAKKYNPAPLSIEMGWCRKLALTVVNLFILGKISVWPPRLRSLSDRQSRLDQY